VLVPRLGHQALWRHNLQRTEGPRKGTGIMTQLVRTWLRMRSCRRGAARLVLLALAGLLAGGSSWAEGTARLGPLLLAQQPDKTLAVASGASTCPVRDANATT